MQEMTSPMRQPVRTEGRAAGSTIDEQRLASRGAGRQRRPDEFGLDCGGALVGCKQDRKGGVRRHQRDLGGVLEAEDENEGGVKRDLRNGRQHAYDRAQERFDGAVARRRNPERNADQRPRWRSPQTAGTAWSPRAREKPGRRVAAASLANTAAGGGSSDGGAMPALVRPCHRARTSAIGRTPSRISGTAREFMTFPPRSHARARPRRQPMRAAARTARR